MKTFRPALLVAKASALLALTLIFAACSRGPTPASVPSPAGTPPSIDVGPPAPGGASVLVATPAGFFLDVVAPKDESVVQESLVQVSGRTVPDAVVSVNGQPVDVDASGNFSATVTLENGPNWIEVIASDFWGTQQFTAVSLIYTS